MARRIIAFFSLVIFTLVFCVACTSTPNADEIAGLIEIDYPMGQELILGQAFRVGIHNYSNQCVFFPADYNIKLFMQNGNKETELGNLVTYYGKDRELTSGGTFFADNVIYFMPDLKLMDYSSSTIFFATIQGCLCDDKDTIIIKTFDFSVK